jgi:hypothetical protein
LRSGKREIPVKINQGLVKVQKEGDARAFNPGGGHAESDIDLSRVAAGFICAADDRKEA